MSRWRSVKARQLLAAFFGSDGKWLGKTDPTAALRVRHGRIIRSPFMMATKSARTSRADWKKTGLSPDDL